MEAASQHLEWKAAVVASKDQKLTLQKLKCLPDQLEEIRSIKSLRITRCHLLPNLPPAIGQLNLMELRIDNCSNLSKLPDEICQLSHLQSLHLEWLFLECLPPTMGNLPLQSLKLQHLPLLTHLPDARDLNLRELVLYCCDALQNLPDSMSSLETLSVLACPQIDNLPPSLGRSRLKSLHLGGIWKLQSIPESIWDLQSLQELGWYGLPELSPGLARLTNLKRLQIASDGFWDWNNVVSAKLPPRLGWLECQALQKTETSILQFLTNNPYVHHIENQEEPLASVQHMLAMNQFRPILEGGHLSVESSTMAILIDCIQTRLNQMDKSSEIPNVIYSLIRLHPVSSWTGLM